MHSGFNATVCMTLRGASRLEERRKALQNTVGTGIRGLRRRKLCLRHGASNRRRRWRGSPSQRALCIAPWQQGRRSRDGRGVGREPLRTTSLESTRQAPAAGAAFICRVPGCEAPLGLPEFPQRRRERVTTRSTALVEGPERRLASPGLTFSQQFSFLRSRLFYACY